MIRDQLCRKCTCSKCSHVWITKTYEIPVRCSKCNSVKWNDDWHATEMPISDPPMESKPVVAPEPKNALEAFIAKAQAIKGVAPTEVVEDVIEREWQFTKDAIWYDDTNAPNRKQWILTGSKPTFRVVEVDEFDHDKIVKVK